MLIIMFLCSLDTHAGIQLRSAGILDTYGLCAHGSWWWWWWWVPE